MALCSATYTVNFLFVSFMFLDITFVFQQCGHVAVLGAGVSTTSSRRHFNRKNIHKYLSLTDEHDEFPLQGLFSTLVNESFDLTERSSLNILLPALEKFENVMIEEAYRVRLTLQDHHERLIRLEMLLGHGLPKGSVTPSSVLSTTQQTVSNLDVPFNDSSNVSSSAPNIVSSSAPNVKKHRRKSKGKKFEKSAKAKRRGDVAVTEMYVDTGHVDNNDTIGNQTTDAKTVDTKTVGAKTMDTKTVGAKTVDAKTKNAKTVDAKTVGAKTVGAKTVDAKTVNLSSNVVNNDTEVSLYVYSNETEDATVENVTLVFINESIREDVNKSRNITKSNKTTDKPSEIDLIQSLKTKVHELELFKDKSSKIRTKSNVRVKQLEKSIVGLRGRFRKLRSKVSMHNNKISNLEVEKLQQEQRHAPLGSQFANYFSDGYQKLDGRVDNLRDLVVRGRGEMRELKQVTEKHEQYIRELQSGSNAQEHQQRELMVRLIGVEQTVRNVYNSVDSHMSAMRWEVQLMLDNVCSNNNLHC